MDSLMDYLDMLEDILESSKTVPFSNKISVDKDKIIDIISEIRMNVPNEIRQAQRMIEDHDKIINDAKSKAANVIKDAKLKAQEMTDDAKLKAEKMTGEHEIYKMSMEQARDIIEEAKKSAKDIRLNAMEYTDGILSEAEDTIRSTIKELDQSYRTIEDGFNKTIDIIYNSRQQLRGSKN